MSCAHKYVSELNTKAMKSFTTVSSYHCNVDVLIAGCPHW